MPARATIPAISSGLSDAPPTSAPSIAGLGEELGDVRGRDAAAVEDRGVIGDAPPPQRSQAVTDRVGHRGGVRARGVAPGPDRPHGLVGDDEARRGERGRVATLEAAAQLGVDDLGLASGLAVREHLADAHDRTQPAGDRLVELLADELVGLARKRAPLGVAEDDPRGEPCEHRDGDLARVGAGQLLVDVLRPDADVLAGDARHGRRPGTRTADRSPG